MKTFGIADTTFARYDMARAVVEELRSTKAPLEVVRTTVPGVKDLPVACKNLIEKRGCGIVLALGYVGGAPIDRECALVADHALQQVQLMTGVHVLGVFVYETEAKDEKELAWLCDRRAREHALNAYWLVFDPDKMAAQAGTGQRQGFEDAKPLPFLQATK